MTCVFCVAADVCTVCRDTGEKKKEESTKWPPKQTYGQQTPQRPVLMPLNPWYRS